MRYDESSLRISKLTVTESDLGIQGGQGLLKDVRGGMLAEGNFYYGAWEVIL